jgi:hypothetical protein
MSGIDSHINLPLGYVDIVTKCTVLSMSGGYHENDH